MIVLCGKTCSGKDTIKRELIERGFEGVVTYTTRPPRAGEIDGVHYHFITQRDFMNKKEAGFFLETTSYQVASGETWYYGTAKDNLKNNSVIIMNPDGIKFLHSCPELKLKSVIFYVYANEETILKRLKLRGDNPDEAARRLEADKKDFEDIEKNLIYDCKLTNEDSESVEEIIDSIIFSNRMIG